MPRTRDFLERFRPAGTPGAATAAGVPADRVAELTAELEPVFAVLADDEREAARIRRAAAAEAGRRRERAAQRAHALVASARQQAEADRAAAMVRAQHDADTTTADTIETATREARDIERRARERLPDEVEQVVAAVRATLARSGILPPRGSP